MSYKSIKIRLWEGVPNKVAPRIYLDGSYVDTRDSFGSCDGYLFEKEDGSIGIHHNMIVNDIHGNFEVKKANEDLLKSLTSEPGIETWEQLLGLYKMFETPKGNFSYGRFEKHFWPEEE